MDAQWFRGKELEVRRAYPKFDFTERAMRVIDCVIELTLQLERLRCVFPEWQFLAYFVRMEKHRVKSILGQLTEARWITLHEEGVIELVTNPLSWNPLSKRRCALVAESAENFASRAEIAWLDGWFEAHRRLDPAVPLELEQRRRFRAAARARLFGEEKSFDEALAEASVVSGQSSVGKSVAFSGAEGDRMAERAITRPEREFDNLPTYQAGTGGANWEGASQARSPVCHGGVGLIDPFATGQEAEAGRNESSAGASVLDNDSARPPVTAGPVSKGAGPVRKSNGRSDGSDVTNLVSCQTGTVTNLVAEPGTKMVSEGETNLVTGTNARARERFKTLNVIKGNNVERNVTLSGEARALLGELAEAFAGGIPSRDGPYPGEMARSEVYWSRAARQHPDALRIAIATARDQARIGIFPIKHLPRFLIDQFKRNARL